MSPEKLSDPSQMAQEISDFLTSDAGQPLTIGSHSFPAIWRFILPRQLDQLPFPREDKATCFDCPRTKDCGYRVDYRCCTYHPRVPNFLLGLASVNDLAKTALLRTQALGMLLPEGMLASPRQWLDFLEDEAADRYGRSQKVLCPLLEPSSGHCSIHKFRNAVCSTYFCEYELGEAGESFWTQVQTLGSQVELILGQWALEQVSFDLDGYLVNLNQLAPKVHELSADSGWKNEVLSQLWGVWWGREFELYQRCAWQLLAKRDQLWEIACKRQLKQAIAFETALDRLAGDEETETEDLTSIDPVQTWKPLQSLLMRTK